jgi:hypothetical protein
MRRVRHALARDKRMRVLPRTRMATIHAAA